MDYTSDLCTELDQYVDPPTQPQEFMIQVDSSAATETVDALGNIAQDLLDELIQHIQVTTQKINRILALQEAMKNAIKPPVTDGNS